jgi:hypothetical protein
MVSKGLYHNFYGFLAGPPVVGPGIPAPDPGDMYFDTGTTALYYWDGSTWIALGASSVDIRESKYIIGDSANGDIAGVNVDFVNGIGIQQALSAMNAAFVPAGRIYIREGTYSAVAPVIGTYGSYQLSAYPLLSGALVIQGAGKDACKIIQTGSRPTFVLNHPAPASSPVLLWGMTVEGSGLVNGTTTGLATIEVGKSGLTLPPQLATATSNVTFKDINVPAQGDFACLGLVNDGVNGTINFTAVDCIFKDANAGAVLASGCVNIGPNAVGFAMNINFTRCQFNACKGTDGSGIKGNAIMGAVFDACSATGNKNAGYLFENTFNISLSDCQAANNSLASVGPTGGFAFISVEDAALTGCIASVNGKAAGAGGDNFLFYASNHCTLSSCIVDGGANGTPENGINFNISNYCIASACVVKGANSMGASLVAGNGFIITGASSYCQINDCHANNCGNYGAYLDTATIRCEIVGGTFINNGVVGPPLGGPYDPNVYDAVPNPVPGTTNELAHFQWQ